MVSSDTLDFLVFGVGPIVLNAVLLKFLFPNTLTNVILVVVLMGSVPLALFAASGNIEAAGWLVTIIYYYYSYVVYNVAILLFALMVRFLNYIKTKLMPPAGATVVRASGNDD